MTDNEIIKALEYCTTDGWCSNCPHEKKCIEVEITQLALDLINRQKANTEGLTNAVKYLNEQLSSAKAEVVKEFAEMFENELTEIEEFYIDEEHENFISVNKVISLLVKLVKEMAGE